MVVFVMCPLVLLDKVADGDFDASSLITNEMLVLFPSVMSKLKTLAADTSMMNRWKIISPGKGKTKVTATNR